MCVDMAVHRVRIYIYMVKMSSNFFFHLSASSVPTNIDFGVYLGLSLYRLYANYTFEVRQKRIPKIFYVYYTCFFLIALWAVVVCYYVKIFFAEIRFVPFAHTHTQTSTRARKH